MRIFALRSQTKIFPKMRNWENENFCVAFTNKMYHFFWNGGFWKNEKTFCSEPQTEQAKIYQFSNKTEDHYNWGYRLMYRIRKKLQKMKIVN